MILKPKSNNTKATSKATTSTPTLKNNNSNDVTSRATTAALHKAKQIMLAGGTQEEAAIAAKNIARQILMEEMNTNSSSRGGSSGGSGSGGDNSRGYSKSTTSRSYNNSGRIGQRSALTLSSNAASNATVSRLAMKTNNKTSGSSGRAGGGSNKGGKNKGGKGLLSKFRNKRKNKKKSKGDNDQTLPGIAEVSLDSHDEGRDELSSSKNDYNTNNGRDGREESSPDTTVSPEPDVEQQREDTVFKQFSNAADTVVELVEKLSGEAPVVNRGENSSDFSSYDSSQDYYVPVENKHVDNNGRVVDDDKNTEGNVEGKMEDLVNLNFVMNAVEKEIFPVAAQDKKKSKQHQKTFSSDDSKELTRKKDGGGGFLSQLCGALFSVEDGICSLGRGESQSFCSNTQSASYEQQHQKTNKTSVPSASLPSVSLDNSSRRHMDNTNDIDGGVEMPMSSNHHKSISWADSHNNQRDDRYGLNIDNTNSTNDSSLIKAMARGMVNGSRSFVQSTRPPQAIETTFDGSTFETKDTYGTNKTSKGTSSKIVGGGEQLVNVEGGVDLVSKNSGKGGAESVSSKVKTILMNKNPFKSSNNQCLGGGGYQCGTSGYYVPPGGEEAGVEVFEGEENVDSNVNWRDMVQDTAPKDLERGRSMSQQQTGGQYQASSGYQASPLSQFQHPTPQEAREYIQMHNPQVSNLPIISQGQHQVVAQLPIVNREPSHIPKVNSNFSVESDDDRQDRYAGMPEAEAEHHQPQYQPQPQQHDMVQMQDGHVMRSDLAYDNTNTMVGHQREVINNSPPVAPPTVTELVMSNTSLFSGLLGDSETGSAEQHVDNNANGGQQGHRMQHSRMQMPTSNKVPFNAKQQYSEIMQIPPFNPNKQRMMSNSNQQLNHQPPQYQQQEYHQQQVDVQTRDPAPNTQLNIMGPPSDYHVQQQQQYHPSQYQQPLFNHGVDPNSGVYYEERNPQPTSPHACHGGYRTFAA